MSVKDDPSWGLVGPKVPINSSAFTASWGHSPQMFPSFPSHIPMQQGPQERDLFVGLCKKRGAVPLHSV